ncbi:hypothetical protein vseg_001589 [Gypsophila vaccaria]
MAYSGRPGPGLPYMNAQFGDTTYTKVFVGGLAWETQSETLRRFFDQFGEILEAVVITDKNTGRSKGYGFVTFRDPEAARRACADPTPVIDGRRANCNLASLGRPRPLVPLTIQGRLRPVSPYIGSPRAGAGSVGYQQPVQYNYQQGYVYSMIPPYGPEYAYPQGIYNPYLGQQYLQLYGVPGTPNAPAYPYGAQAYNAMQTYAMPSHQIVQLSGHGVHAMTSPMPSIQTQYHPGLVAPPPGQPQYVVSAHSPHQFIQGGNSDQTAG